MLRKIILPLLILCLAAAILYAVLFLRATHIEQIGTEQLLAHGRKAAQAHFVSSEKELLFHPVADWRTVLKTLWNDGRYKDGMFYIYHIDHAIKEKQTLHFYRAGFMAGLNQLTSARAELALAGNIQQFSKEMAALESEITNRISTGQFTLMYDRENVPLVSQSLLGQTKIFYDSIQTLLQRSSVLSGLKQQANSTLIYRIQTAAMNALGKYSGAIVLLDTRNGDILAAASNLKDKNSNALQIEYEPGSIIKMITLAGAIETGFPPNKFFPLNCDGHLPLGDHEVLYCWQPHGLLEDINAAAAVSCNVSFAKMGLAMKSADLISNLKKFGFDQSIGSELPIQFGRIIKGAINDKYIADLSIGLDVLKMTPVHGAMVAAAIANGGVCVRPRFIKNYRNVIGISSSESSPVPFRRFMTQQTAAVLTRAMQEVVLNPEGTGRRALIPNLAIAMKTGTAGEGALGYTPFIIGFAPVNKPKVAFAVVVEHAGKAEFEGARITKLFLESIRGYIQ
jgi:membrane peptidoglycan carboxypeptidase